MEGKLVNNFSAIAVVTDPVQFGQSNDGKTTAKVSAKITRRDRQGQEKVDAFITIEGYDWAANNLFQGLAPGHVVAVTGPISIWKSQQGNANVSVKANTLQVIGGVPVQQAPQQQQPMQQAPVQQQPNYGQPAAPQQQMQQPAFAPPPQFTPAPDGIPF